MCTDDRTIDHSFKKRAAPNPPSWAALTPPSPRISQHEPPPCSDVGGLRFETTSESGRVEGQGKGMV